MSTVLKVPVTGELARFVKKKAEEGSYGSANEVVFDALRHLQEEYRRAS